MLRQAYENGVRDALTRYKVANMVQGAAAYNPVLNPSAAGGASTAASAMTASVPKPPTPPASPVAGGAQKSNVLG